MEDVPEVTWDTSVYVLLASTWSDGQRSKRLRDFGFFYMFFSNPTKNMRSITGVNRFGMIAVFVTTVPSGVVHIA